MKEGRCEQEDVALLVEILVEKPDAFLSRDERINFILTLSLAKEAIVRLYCIRKMKLKKVLLCCRHVAWGNDLLRQVAQMSYDDYARWAKFVEALLELDVSVWREYFSLQEARNILDSREFSRLRESLIERIQRSDNPNFDIGGFKLLDSIDGVATVRQGARVSV